MRGVGARAVDASRVHGVQSGACAPPGLGAPQLGLVALNVGSSGAHAPGLATTALAAELVRRQSRRPSVVVRVVASVAAQASSRRGPAWRSASRRAHVRTRGVGASSSPSPRRRRAGGTRLEREPAKLGAGTDSSRSIICVLSAALGSMGRRRAPPAAAVLARKARGPASLLGLHVPQRDVVARRSSRPRGSGGGGAGSPRPPLRRGSGGGNRGRSHGTRRQTVIGELVGRGRVDARRA